MFLDEELVLKVKQSFEEDKLKDVSELQYGWVVLQLIDLCKNKLPKVDKELKNLSETETKKIWKNALIKVNKSWNIASETINRDYPMSLKKDGMFLYTEQIIPGILKDLNI